MPLLDGKRILITGAARGIGLATAETMMAHGAAVMVTDFDAEALREAEAQLRGQEGSAVFHALDVTDPASIDAALNAASATWSGLDGLINNAAMLDDSPTQHVTNDRFETILDVNLTSALRVSQAALPLLRSSGNPSIVNTVSTQAFFGQEGTVAYAAAKGGLMNLTRAMAVDLGAERIRVNAVAPGFINTRMAVLPDGRHEHDSADFKEIYIDRGKIPLRRPGTAEDCAGAFVYLVSDLSRYVTGQAIFVDGGLSVTY